MRRKMPAMWAWVLDPDRMWFHKCDRCQQRKLVANFYEVYGKCGTCPTCKRKGRKPGAGIWWWECTLCLLVTITDRAENRLLVKEDERRRT